MIVIKNAYLGNSTEAYAELGFTDGINIITGVKNHVGKTILMQSMMFVLGFEPKFPKGFDHKKYIHIVDLEIDGREVTIARNKGSFVIKDGERIIPIDSEKRYAEYWAKNYCSLPYIVKKGVSHLAPLSLFTQLSFVTQADKNTSNTVTSYYRKDDFIEMLYALSDLGDRSVDSKEEAQLKKKKDRLSSRRTELLKQAEILKKPSTSLSVVSPTVDRKETEQIIAELDQLGNRIVELKKKRNKALTSKKKTENVLSEMNSLNQELKSGNLVCMNCGASTIGYRMAKSQLTFDITTTEMRSQILSAVQEEIDLKEEEINEINSDIRALQLRFNSIADARDVTLADIFSMREEYKSIEEVDYEINQIQATIEEIDEKIKSNRTVDKNIQEARRKYMQSIVDSMNVVRITMNPDSEDGEKYDQLFTSNANPFIGSEATEYYLARVYSLAINTSHILPILIDSFRAEDLSTSGEELALPLYKKLPNQSILTTTLKEQERGKYDDMDDINVIDYDGHVKEHLLSLGYCEILEAKVSSLGLELI